MNLEAPEKDEANSQLHKQDPRQRHEALAGVRPTEALRWGGHPSAPLQLSVIAAAVSRCGAIDRAPGNCATDCADCRAEQAVSDDGRASYRTSDATRHKAGRPGGIAAIFVMIVISAAVIMMMPVMPDCCVSGRRDGRHDRSRKSQRGQDFRNGTHAI